MKQHRHAPKYLGLMPLRLYLDASIEQTVLPNAERTGLAGVERTGLPSKKYLCPAHFVGGQRGSVLILTLALTAALGATALVFGHAVMLNYRRENNRINALQAEYAVSSALEYVLQIIANAESGTMPVPESFSSEDLSIGNCRVWLLGRTAEPDALEPVFGLIDEAGKLNLNVATLAMLQQAPVMPDELATAIVAWRQPEAETSGLNNIYLTLSEPYVAKQAPFETVGELALLHAATPALLYGRDRNRNGYVEQWEQMLSAETTQRFAEVPDIGFFEIFTVHSREPNRTAADQRRRNLNQAGANPLALLIELFGAERAVAAAEAAGLNRRQFSSVLEFCLRAQLNAAEADQVLDQFTTTDAAMLAGLVNINTASAAVLACLPGIDAAAAAQLVAYRQSNRQQLGNALWLRDAIGEAAALAAAAYVTTRSYQQVADIVAVAANGRAFRRIAYTIDTSSGNAVVVSRRELTHLGWPLGSELRAQLVNPEFTN